LAPNELLNRLRGLSTKELVCVATRFRIGNDAHDVPSATKVALRSVARRYEALSAEIAELDNAATLLVVAGDNPERLRSEASFASLCGISPIEASSGKVVRHRLNLE
jgi:transposase